MVAITAESSPAVQSHAAFELKGTNFTLPVLKLLDTDVTAIAAGLEAKLAEAPQFFRRAPLVIDVQALDGRFGAVEFALLIGALRSNGLVPVGLRGGNAEQNEIAGTMELAVLGQGAPVNLKPNPKPAAKQPAPTPAKGGRLITRPVRSGQRIYATGGDLTVRGSVSSGAEVFADGNVHIYGALRGRAVAGVNGDQEARIFCHGLEAELVSIAGTYRVNEDIDDTLKGKAAQIYLAGKRLTIEPL